MPSSRARPTGRTLALSAVFLAILYVDFASIVNLSDLGVRLPNAPLARYFNGMFRVFAAWSPTSGAFAAVIETDGAARHSEVLDVHALFPMPLGESHSRMDKMYRRGCVRLARELAEIYQRQDPRLDIDRFRLLYGKWPASPNGYYALRDQGGTGSLCIFEEP